MARDLYIPKNPSETYRWMDNVNWHIEQLRRMVMGVAFDELVSGQYLTNTDTTYYTVKSGKKIVIKEIMLFNTDTSIDYLVDAYFVPSGGTAGGSNKVLDDFAVSPATMETINLNTVLSEGSTIVMSASSNSKIMCRISGILLSE